MFINTLPTRRGLCVSSAYRLTRPLFVAAVRFVKHGVTPKRDLQSKILQGIFVLALGKVRASDKLLSNNIAGNCSC